QQLFDELEAIWGMPELVFDANNRGYYFFVDRNGPEVVFGTWEPPESLTSPTDFGTLNGTGSVRDENGKRALALTVDNFANIDIKTDDALYLANADVDDANDIVYMVANSNDYNGGSGGDIVVVQLLNATSYAGQGPAEMDWSLMRWITEDGNGLGDIGADVIYDPSSSTLDVFWSGSGPLTMEAQYFPAHIPKSAIDGQALNIAIVIPERWPIDKIDVNEGDTLAIVGVLKNNGTSALPPMPVTASIVGSDGIVLFSEDFTSIPLGPGTKTEEIEFGSWVVMGSRGDFSLKLKVNVVGDEATFNDEVGTAFFVYPGPGDYLNFETFQDTNFTNFPTFESTGNQIVSGAWFPAAASTGGWTVIDSSNGTFGDARDDYISTWIVDPSVTYEEGNGPPISRDPFALVRHMRGVRGDTLFGDIAHSTLSDSAYAQPQNEVLLSPVYTITGTDDAYALEWDDGISGTDGEFNFPIYAFVDYTTDGGTTWNKVYHRSDMQGEATSIASSGEFMLYDLTSELTGQTSVQFRFWWRNPNNDGGFATWSVDNIYLTTWGGTVANEPGGRSLPAGYALSQNYPNPFNPVTRISYDVPVASEVRIDLYNLLGQRVATLVNGHVTAGRHEVHFNAQELASGVYFYRLVAPNQVITRKMLVLK
ncbi:MAG: T9SS type A sorting domain-containing protein, partial [Candidatus Marinimicrobia bacterium]|nr:T9SS type A sorting domain-containing protein [Candidatus Neomarinimicrobiota bacterium]